MSFVKKLVDPRSIFANPARLLGKQADPLGESIGKKYFNNKATGFGGRTGDLFTSKKADLTGLKLLKSRGVDLNTINGSAPIQPLDGSPTRRAGNFRYTGGL